MSDPRDYWWLVESAVSLGTIIALRDNSMWIKISEEQPFRFLDISLVATWETFSWKQVYDTESYVTSMWLS